MIRTPRGHLTTMTSGPEQELRDLVAERVAAIHAKDPAPLAARHAPDVVAFNVLPPLQLRGADDLAAQTRTWFDSYPGRIGYQVDMWVRATLGCRRIDGAWRIVHDHESVPIDPATGRALIDLAPGG